MPDNIAPETMRAWVLGGPDEISLREVPVPRPGRAEVLVRVDAAAICATDLEVLSYGRPAMIEGALPFHKGHIPLTLRPAETAVTWWWPSRTSPAAYRSGIDAQPW